VTLAGVTGFAVRYRLQIALVALAILAAFAGGYYLRAQSGRVAVDAAWALYQAAFNEDPAERTAALQKVVDGYPGTHSARFASFDLANALYDEGKYEEALEAFQKYEKLEDSEKAIEAYEKVLELAPTSLWADYSSQRLATLSPETHAPAETEPLPPGFTIPFAPVPQPPQ